MSGGVYGRGKLTATRKCSTFDQQKTIIEEMNKMYKIALSNEKGGVGKTSLAASIAAGLAAEGYRVILPDCDPQGHATIMWGLKKEPGLYNLLVRDASFNEVIKEVPPEKFGVPGEPLPKGRLWVIPSNVETRNIASSVSDVGLIGARFEELEDAIDYAVFDTSPTPSLLHGAIYVAADGILYPTKPEIWSFDGLVEAWGHRLSAEKVRNSMFGLPPIKVMGIVPTMVEMNTVEHKENMEKLREQFGDLVWEPIAKRIIWTEMTKFQCPVYGLDPKHEAATDVWRLVKKVKEVSGVQVPETAG
jgi:chromosome partitioning protein